MAPLTASLPKPLIEVAGKPLIEHALSLTEHLPLCPKVVNIHYKANMLRDHFAGRAVLISDESTQLLETGGGLRNALNLLGSTPVMTLNTDAIWIGGNPLQMLISAWRENMEALLLTVPVEKTEGYIGTGNFKVGTDRRLSRGDGEVYTGAQIIRTDDLENIAEEAFSLNVLWDRMLQQNNVYGVSYTGRWCDVGRPECIPIAEAMIAAANV